MKKWILSCKRATYLISLKEEGKLSYIQGWQLRAHLTVCSMCKLFEKQTAFFINNARQIQGNPTSSLSNESKGKMDKVVAEMISKG